MQCPNCYDEEIHGFGLNKTVRRVHLEMENVCCENGFDYYQCPRCAMTRKRRMGLFSSGPIENVSQKEVKEASEKVSEVSGSAVAVGVVGAVALLIGAVLLSDD